MVRRAATALIATLGLTLFIHGNGAAQTNPCNASKLKGAGKKAAGKANCQAKAVAYGTPVDSTCLAKVEVKFSSTYAKAEAKAASTGPACLTTGDAGAIEGKVDGLIDDLATMELTDTAQSKCEATKWKAAGKKAAVKLDCHGKAVAKGIPVDSTCLAKAEIKFSATYAKVDAKGACAGDATAVEGIIDAAVDDIAGELGSGTNLCPDCCAFTRFRFTTGTAVPGSSCGYVSPAVCIEGTNAGNSCSEDLDCPGGDCRGELDCGGFYFGGFAVAVPLPVPVPDLGQSDFAVSGCNPATTVYGLGATTVANTGSIRTCTSSTEPNADYPVCVGGSTPGALCQADFNCPDGGTCTGTSAGCLFGAPQAVVNGNAPATSTCLVHRIASDPVGSGACSGFTSVTVNLATDIYLTYDLVPSETGIQPCPLCDAGVCKGGPNDGLGCTAGTSDLGVAYPTSHDCPPPANYFIGRPVYSFGLQTGSPGLIAIDTDGVGSQTQVFCGFCRNTGGPIAFQNPPVACTDSAECTDPGFPVCQQRNDGAFGNIDAEDLFVSGQLPADCLTDGAAHPARLASAFCIPPAFNALIDAVADIPGPGALTLPGTAQLLP